METGVLPAQDHLAQERFRHQSRTMSGVMYPLGGVQRVRRKTKAPPNLFAAASLHAEPAKTPLNQKMLVVDSRKDGVLSYIVAPPTQQSVPSVLEAPQHPEYRLFSDSSLLPKPRVSITPSQRQVLRTKSQGELSLYSMRSFERRSSFEKNPEVSKNLTDRKQPEKMVEKFYERREVSDAKDGITETQIEKFISASKKRGGVITILQRPQTKEAAARNVARFNAASVLNITLECSEKVSGNVRKAFERMISADGSSTEDVRKAFEKMVSADGSSTEDVRKAVVETFEMISAYVFEIISADCPSTEDVRKVFEKTFDKISADVFEMMSADGSSIEDVRKAFGKMICADFSSSESVRKMFEKTFEKLSAKVFSILSARKTEARSKESDPEYQQPGKSGTVSPKKNGNRVRGPKESNAGSKSVLSSIPEEAGQALSSEERRALADGRGHKYGRVMSCSYRVPVYRTTVVEERQKVKFDLTVNECGVDQVRGLKESNGGSKIVPSISEKASGGRGSLQRALIDSISSEERQSTAAGRGHKHGGVSRSGSVRDPVCRTLEVEETEKEKCDLTVNEGGVDQVSSFTMKMKESSPVVLQSMLVASFPSDEERGHYPIPPMYSERWAGPAYTNSPPPSTLPLPSFPTQRVKSSLRQAMLYDLEGAGSQDSDSVSSSSSPPSSPMRTGSLSFPISVTQSPVVDPSSATKDLKRILNLNADDVFEESVESTLKSIDPSREAATHCLKRILQLG